MRGKNRCDLTPLLSDPLALTTAVEGLAAPFRETSITKVAAVDSMGFVLGGAVAYMLGTGLVLIRKSGKIAWECVSATFTDYSTEQKGFEVAVDALEAKDRVLIIDDWSETGTQLKAAIQLVEQLGGEVAGIACLNIDTPVLRDPDLARYKLHGLIESA